MENIRNDWEKRPHSTTDEDSAGLPSSGQQQQQQQQEPQQIFRSRAGGSKRFYARRERRGDGETGGVLAGTKEEEEEEESVAGDVKEDDEEGNHTNNAHILPDRAKTFPVAVTATTTTIGGNDEIANARTRTSPMAAGSGVDIASEGTQSLSNDVSQSATRRPLLKSFHADDAQKHLCQTLKTPSPPPSRATPVVACVAPGNIKNAFPQPAAPIFSPSPAQRGSAVAAAGHGGKSTDHGRHHTRRSLASAEVVAAARVTTRSSSRGHASNSEGGGGGGEDRQQSTSGVSAAAAGGGGGGGGAAVAQRRRKHTSAERDGIRFRYVEYNSPIEPDDDMRKAKRRCCRSQQHLTDGKGYEEHSEDATIAGQLPRALSAFQSWRCRKRTNSFTSRESVRPLQREGSDVGTCVSESDCGEDEDDDDDDDDESETDSLMLTGRAHHRGGCGRCHDGNNHADTTVVDSGGGGTGGDASGSHGQRQQSTWRDQLFATVQREMTERRRSWINILLEILIPLVCVVCTVILWAAFGDSGTRDITPFFKYRTRYNLHPGSFRNSMCFNDTWVGSINYIAGLYPCSKVNKTIAESGKDGEMVCPRPGKDIDDDTGIDPVMQRTRGLCFERTGASVALFMSSFMRFLSEVPPIDDVIANQWMARHLGTSQGGIAAQLLVSAGLATSNRYSAVSTAGMIYFAPREYVTDELLNYISSNSKMFRYVFNGTFETVEEARATIAGTREGHGKPLAPTWALVVLHKALDESGVDIEIQMQRTVFPTFSKFVNPSYPGGFVNDQAEMYLISGYAAIFRAVVDYYFSTPVSGIPGTTKDRFTPYVVESPFVPYKFARVLEVADSILGFVVVLAFLYPVAQSTRRLVLSKELRIREASLIMGLKGYYVTISWLLHSSALYFVISFLVTMLLKATFVVHSDAFCIFLAIFLFSLTTIPLSGLLATFFSHSRMAALLTPLIYFAMAVPVFAMKSAPPVVITVLCLLSPTAFATLLSMIFVVESGDGFSTEVFNDSTVFTPTVAVVLGFLAFDFVIYLLLMLYLEQVLPREVGTAKHPLFFIIDMFSAIKACCSRGSSSLGENRDNNRIDNNSNKNNNEAENHKAKGNPYRSEGNSAECHGTIPAASPPLLSPPAAAATAAAVAVLHQKHKHSGDEKEEWEWNELPDGRDPNGVFEDEEAINTGAMAAEIKGLRKSFRCSGRDFLAVNNLFWHVPDGCVSVLLGHNGAGKSTVLHMMTGMLAPDAGDCLVYGLSVRKHIDAVRQEIGFCPQHNILWPQLTCREHLQYFAKIKGLRGPALEDAVHDTLVEVDLLAKAECPSRALSGGQKRKLSVAIAFVGGSKLVILDEPTAGMDVAARRHTWELLLRLSRRRAVLLTTHFMDEADLLGDRIAIMGSGRLKCSGSSLFLKSRLGLGYNITMSVQPVLADLNRLARLVAFHVPAAEPITSGGCEISYRLPAGEVATFSGLLAELEDAGPGLGVCGYALSATTLEEVFLKVAEQDRLEEVTKDEVALAKMKDSKGERKKKNKGMSLGDTTITTGRTREGWLTSTEVCAPAAASATVSAFCVERKDTRAVPAGNTPPREGFDDDDDDNTTTTNNAATMVTCVTDADDAGKTKMLASMRTRGEGGEEEGGSGSTIATAIIAADPSSIEHDSRSAATTTIAGIVGDADTDTQNPPLVSAPAPADDLVWNCEIAYSSSTIMRLQFEAMFRKRLHNSRRDKKLLCFQILCPVVCVLFAMFLNLVNMSGVEGMIFTADNYPRNAEMLTMNCDHYFNASDPLAGRRVSDKLSLHQLHYVDAVDFYYYQYDKWSSHGDVGRYSSIFCDDSYLAQRKFGLTYPAVVMYNSSSVHEVMVGLVNLYNLVLQSVKGSSAKITARASFLPSSVAEELSSSGVKGILMGIIIMIPFTFLPSNCVSWIVKERECKARHLQDVSGLRYLIYWTTNYVFDMALYIITLALVLIIFAIFRRSEYIGADTIGGTIVLFLTFGFCSTATAYFLHFAFSQHSSAQTITMIAGFVTGFLLVIIVFILDLVETTREASSKMRIAFRFIPTYAVGEGIINLAMLKQHQVEDPSMTVWSMPILGYPCLYMALETPVFLLLTVLIDHPYWRMWWQRRRYDPNEIPDLVSGEDTDVEDERTEAIMRATAGVYHRNDDDDDDEYKRSSVSDYIRNSSASMAEDAVSVICMRKVYPSGKVAVRNITFGVVPGEVFGFLGTNGAGKTTTISILCQETLPSCGRAYVCGYDIIEESTEALQCIGYCPQFDATLDLLTVEEHLYIFAGIRGIIAAQHDAVVSQLLTLCGLTKYRTTLSGELSGGNRRKLSVALALLGGPQVVFLDEPSAGMDPVARRGLWTSIQAVANRCSVVLTTHHLEEVEALADCVAIMVDGSLRCIGDKTHLKQKYGTGFEMNLRVGTGGDCEKVKAFIAREVPHSTLNEMRGARLVYALPQGTVLSEVFDILQRYKEELGVTDYSVSQTSIEQVFMRISDEAEESERIRGALEERRWQREKKQAKNRRKRKAKAGSASSSGESYMKDSQQETSEK